MNLANSGFGFSAVPKCWSTYALRSEQALFLAAPERDANRAARLHANRLQDARGFHHHGAADRVVRRARGGVPGIEMAAEHHDFIGLVGAGNLRDGVVGRLALRIDAVLDVELERHGRAVGQNARDAAVVFIAHHDGRQVLRQVVGRAVERANLAVLAARVVDAHGRAARQEPSVDHRRDLARVETHGTGRRRRRRATPPPPACCRVALTAAATAAAPAAAFGSGLYWRLRLGVVTPLGRRVFLERHDRRRADQDDGALRSLARDRRDRL